MTNEKYLEEIEKTYRTIDNSFDTALKKCSTTEEKELLITSRDTARNAFWTAVDTNLSNNSIFTDKSSMICKLPITPFKNNL